MAIIQSNDGNKLLLLLQRQWAARLKIIFYLPTSFSQSCIINQENQLVLEGALLLDPQGSSRGTVPGKYLIWGISKTQ